MKKRMTFFPCLIPLVLGALLAGAVHGQTPPLWGEIKPGPYAVGFRTIEKYDYSRTFQPAKDYFGTPLPGEAARPIQVCYWYPAEPGGTRMVYSEYAFPYPSEPGFFDLLSQLQNRELGTLFFFLGNNQALAQDLMNLEMLAVHEAAPSPGTFPLIVYHGGERSAYSQNVVLCEYLASQGFVVATTHTFGLTSAVATDNPSDIEAVIRDKELVVAMIRDQGGIDTERLGLLGYDYGASTALLHQMRNYAVDGVATLHGRFLMSEGSASLFDNGGYDRLRMTVPWLQVYSTEAAATDLSAVDSLRHSYRYSLGVSGIPANYFSAYGLMAVLMRADTTRTPAQASQTQSSVFSYLHRFFDGCLNGNEESLAWLKKTPEQNGMPSGLFTLVTKDGEPVPPGQAEFANLIQTYGTVRAAELIAQFNLVNPTTPILPDATFTQLGYQFLQRGDVASSLVVFRWGVTAYPNSANAWDSFGEATAANGDIDSALAYYRKAEEVLPIDSLINPQMRDILVTSVPTNIARLEQLIAERASGADSTGGGN